jgi:hypothetical protein
MGQTQSSAISTSEDLLYNIFDNDAVCQYLISTGQYRVASGTQPPEIDTSPGSSGSDSSSSADNFEDVKGPNEKFDLGSKYWWKKLITSKTGSSEKERLTKLNQILHELEESSGSSQLLQDPLVERRLTTLKQQYNTLKEGVKSVQQGQFNSLDSMKNESSSATLPVGVKVGLTTSIKVVVALLQHNALANPPLCVSVLDIFIDALQRLPPLSLNETELGTTNVYGLLGEGVTVVSDFLVKAASLPNTGEESHDAVIQTLRNKAIEAIVQLVVASGSLTGSLLAISLLLKVHKENSNLLLNVSGTLAKLSASRDPLKQKWGAGSDKPDDFSWDADVFKVDLAEGKQLRPWEVLIVFMRHLAELVRHSA